MHKVKLNADAMNVESFAVGGVERERGTVRAADALTQVVGGCCTRMATGCVDATTIYTGQCCP
jgi:hypothetical protein